jgi:hypothetical protein
MSSPFFNIIENLSISWSTHADVLRNHPPSNILSSEVEMKP